MKIFTGAVAWAAVAVLGVDAGAGTPVMQAVKMLTNMKVKGQEMIDEEQKTFDKYAKWARNQSRVLGREIETGARQIEELTAAADKADSDAAEHGRRIDELDAEIDKLSAQKEGNAKDREAQHAEYLQVSTDLAESVDALERAIQTLSAQNYDRPQAEALLQELGKTSAGMPRVLAALMQEKRSGSLRGDGAPAVNGYEAQSGGVLTLLKKLLDEFRDQLGETEKSEMNAAHNAALADSHLGNTISANSADRDEHASARGKRAAAAAKAKAELAAVKEGKAASEKLKSETESTFDVKSQVFAENQSVRKSELEAIEKAIEILSSKDVSAGYAKHIASLDQQKQQSGARGVATSFLQVGRSRRSASVQERAVEFLRDRAGALRSDSLAKVVAALVTGSPFDKVISMIESLLDRLKEEAASEAEHKEWCDKELKANKLKRNKKTAQANELTAEIEGWGPTIADLGTSIQRLAAEAADLRAAVAESTTLRQQEKADNAVAIEDAKSGEEAIKRARAVLTEFYAAQGEGSLIQTQQVPELEAYKGMQRSQGGVVAMLEVIESDFSRLRSETQASETAAASEYERFMAESEVALEQKREAEFKLRLEKDQAEFEKSTAEKNLERVSAELAKANQYFDQLKPSCIQVHVSFEERSARRQEEIEALKKAYEILDQKSAASA